MRRAWIWGNLLALVIAGLPVGGANAVEPKPEGAFRLVAYNIRHGTDGSGKNTLAQIAAWIRAADPDLVFLSEVDDDWRRSGYINQVEYLAAETGLNYRYYAPALVSRSLRHTALGRTARYGNAFLSKHPFLAKEEIPLPRLGRNEPRNTLLVEVPLAGSGHRLRVYGTHLSVRPGERAEQLAFLRGRLAAEQGYTVFLGDLNSPPERLAKEAPYLSAPAWRDVLAEAPATFPTENPEARIDYIFVSDSLEDWVRFAAAPDVRASDHRPVVLDLAPPSAGSTPPPDFPRQ